MHFQPWPSHNTSGRTPEPVTVGTKCGKPAPWSRARLARQALLPSAKSHLSACSGTREVLVFICYREIRGEEREDAEGKERSMSLTLWLLTYRKETLWMEDRRKPSRSQRVTKARCSSQNLGSYTAPGGDPAWSSNHRHLTCHAFIKEQWQAQVRRVPRAAWCPFYLCALPDPLSPPFRK